jgi:hypothetical protein
MKSQEEKTDGNKKNLEEKIKPLGKIPVLTSVDFCDVRCNNYK